MSLRKTLLPVVLCALIFLPIAAALFSIKYDVEKAQGLEAVLSRNLGNSCRDCYITVFGGDARVFVYAPQLSDLGVSRIAKIAFAEGWVRELDVRNTRLSSASADRLISEYPEKRILTRFNAKRVDPFLYD